MDKGIQGWSQLTHGQQHLVPAQRVESVFEVQLHNPVVVIKVTGIHSSGVDCCFCAPLGIKPELPWCQEGGQLLPHFARCNCSNKTAEGTTHCNGLNFSVLLVEGSQVDANEEGMNGQWSSAFQHQLHEGNKCREEDMVAGLI